MEPPMNEEADMKLNNNQKMEIRRLAVAAAQAFVDEFDEPLDSSKTDWDAVAWQEDRRKLSFRAALKASSDLDAEAWELYSTTLEAKTGTLCN